MNEQTETLETPQEPGGFPFSTLKEELKVQLLEIGYFFLLIHRPGALKYLPLFSSMNLVEKIRALAKGGTRYVYLKFVD
jgi:hypothetical protein